MDYFDFISQRVVSVRRSFVCQSCCQSFSPCRFEVNEARAYNIPIVTVVDVDRQLAREVIDKHLELGYSWLFSEQ